MNILDSQQRRTAPRRVWTEHDDELIEMMASLFGDRRETGAEAPPATRPVEQRRAVEA